MASKTSEKVVNRYVQSKAKYLVVSPAAKVAIDVLRSCERTLNNYNNNMGVAGNGTIDVDNSDLHGKVRSPLNKLKIKHVPR